MENSIEEVIDLTTLDYCIPCSKPIAICGEVIDLADDSFHAEKTKHKDKTKRKPKVKDSVKKTIEKDKEQTSSKVGHCSICWEKLGKNPLASTKCGHVYCLICLEKSLKCNKRCPTCRQLLKGATAYHPLYLELG